MPVIMCDPNEPYWAYHQWREVEIDGVRVVQCGVCKKIREEVKFSRNPELEDELNKWEW